MHENAFHIRSQEPKAAAPSGGTSSADPAHEMSKVWIVVAAVCIGSFIGQLDAGITQLVLPALERAFPASAAEATLSAGAADLTSAPRMAVSVLALLASLAALLYWVRPAGPSAAHERQGAIPDHFIKQPFYPLQSVLRNRYGDRNVG